MNKVQLIAQCKSENEKMFSTINGEQIELTGPEYESACEKWADMRLEQMKADQAKVQGDADKATLLARLGLTEDELKTILG
jgi:hypothetical protein